MTNIVLIQGHPDPAGDHLCHAIADAYTSAAQNNGHSVTALSVAAQDVPMIRSAKEWDNEDLPAFVIQSQAALETADHVVLIYPLWLGDMPAVVKAWFEQVLRKSFVFQSDGRSFQGKLNGKSARVMVTMGMPGLAYRWFFMAHSLRSLKRNILKFCGLKPVRWTVFGNVEDASGRAQQNALRTARKLGANAR